MASPPIKTKRTLDSTRQRRTPSKSGGPDTKHPLQLLCGLLGLSHSFVGCQLQVGIDQAEIHAILILTTKRIFAEVPRDLHFGPIEIRGHKLNCAPRIAPTSLENNRTDRALRSFVVPAGSFPSRDRTFRFWEPLTSRLYSRRDASVQVRSTYTRVVGGLE